MGVFVGLDLVDVESVQATLGAHGDSYLSRIFTETERDECGSDTRKLATRFAAKEAVMKALGRTEEPLAWSSIEVVARQGSAPELLLHGAALELARRRGIGRLSLSLSGAGGHAAAIVIGETGTEGHR
ncbi:MAG: holo-ACP synthase [Solirubrobacteraceae bacterium]